MGPVEEKSRRCCSPSHICAPSMALPPGRQKLRRRAPPLLRCPAYVASLSPRLFRRQRSRPGRSSIPPARSDEPNQWPTLPGRSPLLRVRPQTPRKAAFLRSLAPKPSPPLNSSSFPFPSHSPLIFPWFVVAATPLPVVVDQTGAATSHILGFFIPATAPQHFFGQGERH